MEEELWDWWFESPDKSAFYIHRFGALNPSDGPDILDAEIEIDGKTFRGSIEFDYDASGWVQHGHFQHFRYEHTLLHIFYKGVQPFYHGNKPHFSFKLGNDNVSDNYDSIDSFSSRKSSFLAYYIRVFNRDDLLFLLLCRTLGYYHNRELMTYVAYVILTEQAAERDIKIADVLAQSKKRAVRPHNRLNIRVEQAFALVQNPFWTSELHDLLKKRLALRSLLLATYKLLNDKIPEKTKIGRDRIKLFFFNWVIPLLYLRHKGTSDIGFCHYLEELFDDFKLQAIVTKVHSKSDLEIRLSDLSLPCELTF